MTKEQLAINMKRPSLGAILSHTIDRGATAEELTELRLREMKLRYFDAFDFNNSDDDFLRSLGATK